MQIVVINLKRSMRRRAACELNLARYGLRADFFRACEAEYPEAAWFERIDDEAFVVNTGRNPRAGEVACFASHKTLWQQCVKSEKPILIMEDDFQLEPAFPEALDAAAQLVNEYGFIRLQSETRARSSTIKICGQFTLRLFSKAPHSMMCYALSPAAAAGLLAHCDVLKAPVDVFVKQFWLHRQAIYGLQPYTVTESELASESFIGYRPKAVRSLAIRLKRQVTRYVGAMRGALHSRNVRRQLSRDGAWRHR